MYEALFHDIWFITAGYTAAARAIELRRCVADLGMRPRTGQRLTNEASRPARAAARATGVGTPACRELRARRGTHAPSAHDRPRLERPRVGTRRTAPAAAKAWAESPHAARGQWDREGRVSDRLWEDSIAVGLRNQRLIELAQHHCTLMEFVQSSGRGMAEEATGLPINMRQNPVPSSARQQHGVNLEFTVPNFYRQHCVGCGQRHPTGAVPNLASVVEEQDAERERTAAEKAARIELLRDEWRQRGLVRQALAARFDDVMGVRGEGHGSPGRRTSRGVTARGRRAIRPVLR